MRKTAIAVCLMASATIAVAAAPAEKAVPAKKAASAKKAPPAPAMEKLTCRTGPNDEQVRLIAQVVKGRTMEFAYYSRLGTSVCSIHGRRGDAYTKWADGEGKSTVKLLGGTAELEYKPGNLKIKFDDVDRMTYCGMHGELNGSIEVTRGKAECRFSGVFDLGSAAIVLDPKQDSPKPEGLKPEGAGPVDADKEKPKKDDLKQEEPKQEDLKQEGLKQEDLGQAESRKSESKP